MKHMRKGNAGKATIHRWREESESEEENSEGKGAMEMLAYSSLHCLQYKSFIEENSAIARPGKC